MPGARRVVAEASSGRGLLLMEMLADAWGVEPRGEGKSVWFELYESAVPETDPDPGPGSTPDSPS